MSDTSREMLQPTPDAPKGRRPIWVRVLKWTLASLAIVVGTPVLLWEALGLVMMVIPPSYGPTESTELRRFAFVDRTFAIPRNFHPTLFRHGVAQPYGFAIDALLPDFAPYSKARHDEWFAVGTGKPRVWISADSAATALRPEELVRSRLDYAIDQIGRPGPAGLRRYDMRDGSPTFYDIVYVPEQPGDVILIGCTIHEGEMTGCWIHTIYDYAANLEIGFNSHFLADWREIADGARRLLRSFETY